MYQQLIRRWQKDKRRLAQKLTYISREQDNIRFSESSKPENQDLPEMHRIFDAFFFRSIFTHLTWFSVTKGYKINGGYSSGGVEVLYSVATH